MCSQATSQLELVADGVPAALGRLIAERTGSRLEGGRPDNAPFVTLIGDVTEERLAHGLARPAVGCIEVLSADDPAVDEFLRQPRPDMALSASLTSVTAHSIDLSRLFVAELGARLQLDQERHQALELAIHEALVNALLHGNLEVGPLPKETVEEFIAYCNAVEARLADPDYAQRRLQLDAVWTPASVTVTVRDRGPGYDIEALEPKTDPTRKTGRGLFLIGELAEEVAVEDGGRRLVMRFSR